MRQQPNQDAEACRALLRGGSRSFAWAGAFLGRERLDGAAALYAFCRQADDAIDDALTPAAARAAHAGLRRRLGAIERAPAADALVDPVDRALKRALVRYTLPCGPLYALLEGFLWDAEGRCYARLPHTLAYAARVAGSVGVLLARICGATQPDVLARAADMGVAMQLTNIARDVGEDARRGRVYLPETWLRTAGLSPEAMLAQPRAHAAIARTTARLLHVADLYYARARSGLPALPLTARLAMACAGRLYQGIGGALARSGHDNMRRRAFVGPLNKAWLCARALVVDCLPWPRRRANRLLARPPSPATAPLLAARWPAEAALAPWATSGRGGERRAHG